MKKRLIRYAFFVLLLLFTSGTLAQAADTQRPEGWDDYSHSNDTDPDYDVVFPQDAVNTITITISPENWQVMMDDMTELYGEFGESGGRGGMPGGDGDIPQRRPRGEQNATDEGFEPPEGFEIPEGFEPPEGFEMPEGFEPPEGFGGRRDGDGGRGFGIGGLGTSEDPVWVNADLEFNGNTWTNVGIRFKGNSSLRGSWQRGVYKIPFRLNFDKFEDDYPEIHNQRFYGFKKLSFTNNWNDASFLREKAATDIFRASGVASSQTAFYAVYIDYGEGPQYFGLYTGVEVIDDTVIETQFDDDSGNLYKPEGTAATFMADTFNEEELGLKTNEDEADYSDIQALLDALHAETRLTDAEAWREELESVFDADQFVHWLAINSVIQNWDTYGSMAHNFYIYHDPSTDLLTWIPWDLDLSMQSGGMGGGMGRGGGGGGRNNSAIDQENINENWPLIRYLMDDPVYHALYVDYVEETINGPFSPEVMTEEFTRLHTLVAPYATSEVTGYTHLSSTASFENSLETLINHVNQRYELAQEYISAQRQ